MKRLSALFVTLIVATIAFAQGSVTVTQSSAISDVVNGNRSTTNKQQNTATKPQTTTTTKPQNTTTKPQTTTTQKPQNTTTKPQTTTTTQKPQNTTTKPQTTTTTQKPQTPVAQTPPPTPQKQNTTGNAETNTQGATTGETAVTTGESTETEQTEGQTTGGGGGTATKPHTYTRQPARPQTNAAATTKMSQEDEILARTKERPVDYSSKSKKIMKGGYKIKGYRLQIFNGGNKGIDKKKAQEAAEKVKKQYPNLPVYVHFYAPRWMTLCGNYRTHKEAEAAQKQFIIAGFKKASIVRQEVIIE